MKINLSLHSFDSGQFKHVPCTYTISYYTTCIVVVDDDDDVDKDDVVDADDDDDVVEVVVTCCDICSRGLRDVRQT